MSTEDLHDLMRKEPRAAIDPGAAAMTKGQRFLEADRHDLAERAFREAVAHDAENARALTLLAYSLYLQDRDREAAKVIRQALRLAPDYALPHMIHGRILMARGRNRDAEQAIQQALRLDPEDSRSFYSYGQLLYKTGHFEKAAKLLRRALELDPEDAEAHSLLALVLNEQKKREPAEAHGRHSLSLAPDDSAGHYVTGCTLLERGRPFAARRHLREALRLRPNDAGVEENFLLADRSCRIVGLPYYWYSLVLDRLPGANFGLWGLFIVGYFALKHFGAPPMVILVFAFTYISTCAYSWVANPIIDLWVKWFPPR